MSGAPFEVWDLVDLALMRASKVGRKKLDQSGDTQAFYEEFFTDDDEHFLTDGKDRRKVVRLQGVLHAVKDAAGAGGKVLDVGCGVGDTLKMLSGVAGLELHGVEYSKASLARAERHLGANVALKQGSAMALPYGDGEFDVVTCIEVLEHLSDDAGALREMARVLKPSGSLVLTVPSRHWFPMYRALIGHERHYDRRSLSHTLEVAGFQIVDFIPNFPRWHRAADYGYAFCRALGRAAAKVGHGGSPYDLQLPFTKRPLMAATYAAIEPLYEADQGLKYAKLDTSTSVVARRVARSPRA